MPVLARLAFGLAGVRVLTWNLWWRFGDWQQRQSAIAAVLAVEQPDICGLQEVWVSPTENQAQRLADELGMHWAVGLSPRPERSQRRIGDSTVGFANAVLSRWPISASDELILPPGAGRIAERTALHAHIDAPATLTSEPPASPARASTTSWSGFPPRTGAGRFGASR